MAETEYNFEPFAKTAEYKGVNRKIIISWIAAMVDSGVERVGRLLDIATGVGTMVRLFLEELPTEWDQPEVICLDKSEKAIQVAQDKLSSVVKTVHSIHSPIQDMKVIEEKANVVLWGNGIHNLSEEDQEESVKRIAQNLDKDGWFFFNTAFYEGARPEGTKSFYRFQVKKAVEILREEGIQRERKKEKAEAAKFHPRSHYRELVEKAGLELHDMEELAAPLYKEAWEYISGFKNYALGALHGYPVKEAQSALEKAVAPAIQKYGIDDGTGELYIPRKWLRVSSRLS
ncbi:class I SAM-dependent methyltransferase [Candidatus Bipolaricaulota bacterium]|nr:class I SAM-dependent methyltransferase [Candidatus Bipolaricaulota bacterium]